MVGGGRPEVDPDALRELDGTVDGHEVTHRGAAADDADGTEATAMHGRTTRGRGRPRSAGSRASRTGQARCGTRRRCGSAPSRGHGSAARDARRGRAARAPGPGRTRTDVTADGPELLGEHGELLVVGAAERREPVGRAAPPLERLEDRPAAARHGELEVQLGEPGAVQRTSRTQVEARTALLPAAEPTRRRARGCVGPARGPGGDSVMAVTVAASSSSDSDVVEPVRG